MLCDKRTAGRAKAKVYKMAARPTGTLTKRKEVELEVVVLKMLKFSFGVTKLDKTRNESNRGAAKVECISEKMRDARLKWYGRAEEG